MGPDDSPIHTVEWRCLECRRIPWDYEQWPSGSETTEISHHLSFTALEQSAANGCYLCRSLRAQLLYESGSGQLWPGQLKIELEPIGDESSFSFGANEKWQPLVTKKANLPGESLDAIRSQFGVLATLKRLAPDTLGQDLECLVKDRIHPWIKECLTGSGRHEKCTRRKLKQDENFHLPTRLIDVGDDRSSSVRLVVSSDELSKANKPDYLSLSYCWGQGNEPAKTTRANLRERRQCITPASLPKTIQDAIKLTRLIGVRYLWVDAICIIQPHPGDKYLDDWTSEAPKMGSYYSNALCLISALAASDSSQGLFKERQSEKYPTKSCTIAFDSSKNKYIYLPIPVPDFTLSPDCPAVTEPLMTRSWCLQERLLSPRALHWSTNGLFWQCLGVPEDSEFTPVFRRIDGIETTTTARKAMQRVFTVSGDEAMGSMWKNIVYEYSGMGLTYKTDRLAAIQGLGDRLAAMHGSEYFAGVFRSHLAQGLIWQSHPPDMEREKLAHFPTWSWASCVSRHGVMFQDLESTWLRCPRPDIFPLEHTATNFSDPSKRILRIEAPLLLLNLKNQYHREETILMCKEWELRLYFDKPELEPNPLEQLLVLALGRTKIYELVGIIVRPNGNLYERIGLVVGYEGEVEVSYEDFRMEVELV